MNVLDMHRQAMAGFDRTVRLVKAGQRGNSTPCTEWTVRDLVNHIVSEQQPIQDEFAEELLRVVGPMLKAKPPAPGLVAPPVAVPDTASAPDRLVALLGREPR